MFAAHGVARFRCAGRNRQPEPRVANASSQFSKEQNDAPGRRSLKPTRKPSIWPSRTEKVCYIIAKAREFDGKEGDADPDAGSNETDDGGADVLEDKPGDSVQPELIAFINSLDEEEQITLVALAWLRARDLRHHGMGRRALHRAHRTQQANRAISSRSAHARRLSGGGSRCVGLSYDYDPSLR